MTQSSRFTRTIERRDETGAVALAREVGTYAGVLNRAHHESLQSITTTLVQAPSAANQMTAIFYAEVGTKRGVVKSHGDASSKSVESEFSKRYIAVAETRAKSRTLGDAIYVGAVSASDLSKGDPAANGGGDAPNTNGSTATAAAALPLSDRQRERPRKLLALRGYDDASADAWLCRTGNVDQVDRINRKQASEMIDHLIADTSLIE